MNSRTKFFHACVIALAFAIAGCTSQPKTAPTALPVTPAATTAEPPIKTVPGEPTILCKRGTEVRSLQIKKIAGGCELLYSKFGKTSLVASSTKGLDHCQKSHDKVTTNLKAANFKCD